jgi:hypothetical protein
VGRKYVLLDTWYKRKLLEEERMNQLDTVRTRTLLVKRSTQHYKE